MYQKQQPLIISSKRNTTYLMPLMNSNNIENENNNNNNLTNANPFPVNHINSNASAIIKDKNSYTGNFLFF